MSHVVTPHRDQPHPWNGTPGWDRLEMKATTPEELNVLMAAAERKHWRLWHADARAREAVMIKPSGADAPWEHEKREGRDREASRAIKTGQEVYCDYSGRITRHIVKETQVKEVCGCGHLLKVTPIVPKSDGAWLDAGWFRLVQ